ncbi:RagB/SusD family nutrient uptake outer membrane protein [Hymenobacter terrigena]
MKHTFIRPAVLALALGLSLTGCKDPLDIAPQQGIDVSVALTTPEKVGGAVVGLYAKLDDPRLYGTDLILVPELIGSENYIRWDGTFTNYRQIATRSSFTSLNTTAAGIWQRAYEDINQANLVLSALPVVTNADLKAQYEGEARFVRGLLYFNLVRLYGQQYQPGTANSQLGVPITLSANTTVDQATVKLPRATVAQVYAQVIDDLTTAMQKLPASNGTRATTYAAEALLARVYLQQSNFTAARAAADDVINHSGKSLAGSVAAIFANRNGSETLFEIQQNDQNNAGTSNDGLATYFASDGGVGRGDVRILPAFSTQYEDSDARGTDSLAASATRKLIYLGDGARPGRLRSIKYRTYGQNIPVIRLAEMYLIRAEADVRAGNTADALADVNRIRTRSGATPLTTVTLQDVLHERQLELAFEGFHIYDLKRTNAVIVPAIPATPDNPAVPAVNANDPKLILPIPQHDINLNELLVQNPSF